MKEDANGRGTELTVIDYFNFGLRRERHERLTSVGQLVREASGLGVRYSLRVESGIVNEVSFKASTCVTLVAYCELLAQTATGVSLQQAICIDPEKLTQRLAGVPRAKYDRAWLAVQAMQSAIAAAVNGNE